MKWQATLLVIATGALGCDPPPGCPGPSVCPRGASFQTNNACWCTCQPAQKTDPEHMCCDSAAGCQEASSDPDAAAGMTPATVPRVSVEGLNAFVTSSGDWDIRACEGFTVAFAYVNRANGLLKDAIFYGRPAPQLLITEVTVGGSATLPMPREVPWTTDLAPGVLDPKSEEYDDGINPNNVGSSTRVAVQVDRLPATASGVTAIGKDIGRFGSACGS